MGNKVAKKVQKLGRNLVDMFLGEDERLIKKYVLDGEGKLKLYSPEVQVILLKMLRANGLVDVLKEREEAEDNDCCED